MSKNKMGVAMRVGRAAQTRSKENTEMHVACMVLICVMLDQQLDGEHDSVCISVNTTHYILVCVLASTQHTSILVCVLASTQHTITPSCMNFNATHYHSFMYELQHNTLSLLHV